MTKTDMRVIRNKAKIVEASIKNIVDSNPDIKICYSAATMLKCKNDCFNPHGIQDLIRDSRIKMSKVNRSRAEHSQSIKSAYYRMVKSIKPKDSIYIPKHTQSAIIVGDKIDGIVEITDDIPAKVVSIHHISDMPISDDYGVTEVFNALSNRTQLRDYVSEDYVALVDIIMVDGTIRVLVDLSILNKDIKKYYNILNMYKRISYKISTDPIYVNVDKLIDPIQVCEGEE